MSNVSFETCVNPQSPHVEYVTRLEDYCRDIVTKSKWRRVAPRIRVSLQKGDVMCRKSLSNAYISALFKDTARPLDVVFIMHALHQKRSARVHKSMAGFVLCQFVSSRDDHLPDGLRVRIICARQGGKVLLQHVEHYAREIGLGHVELEAVPNVINFYRSCGYRHVSSCAEQEDASVAASAEQQRTKRFKRDEDIVKDRSYVAFMRKLVDNGMSVTCKAQKHNKITDKHFFNPPPSRKINQNSETCDEDGFRMMHCFHKSADDDATEQSAVDAKSARHNTKKRRRGRSAATRRRSK